MCQCYNISRLQTALMKSRQNIGSLKRVKMSFGFVYHFTFIKKLVNDWCLLQKNIHYFMFILFSSSVKYVGLLNAVQTKKVDYGGCKNKCYAKDAIDGSFSTSAVTSHVSPLWWSVEFKEEVLVEKIFVYVDNWPFDSRFFSRFKVETGLSRTDDGWIVCKAEYDMPRPHKPHITQCDTPQTAKYLRLSIKADEFHIIEVWVSGIPPQGN